MCCLIHFFTCIIIRLTCLYTLSEVYDSRGLEAIPTRISVNPTIPSFNSPVQFAVACSNSGEVHIHSQRSESNTSWQHTPVRISRATHSKNRFNIEGLCWGHNATSGWLFAGTDECDDQERGCYIAGMDVHTLLGGGKAKPTWAVEASSVQVLCVDGEGTTPLLSAMLFRC